MLERWLYGGWWENIFSPSFRASFVRDLTSHHLQHSSLSDDEFSQHFSDMRCEYRCQATTAPLIYLIPSTYIMNHDQTKRVASHALRVAECSRNLHHIARRCPCFFLCCCCGCFCCFCFYCGRDLARDGQESSAATEIDEEFASDVAHDSNVIWVYEEVGSRSLCHFVLIAPVTRTVSRTGPRAVDIQRDHKDIAAGDIRSSPASLNDSIC